MVAPFKETPMHVAMTMALAKPSRAGNDTNGGIHWGSRIGLTVGPRNPQLRDVVLLSHDLQGFNHPFGDAGFRWPIHRLCLLLSHI